MRNRIINELFISKVLTNNWPLIKKFSSLRQLNHVEIKALMKMHQKTRMINARKTFLNQGEIHEQSLIVTQGWACRFRNFSNGNQQIINYYLPGDIISPFSSVLPRINYSVASITSLQVCPFDRDDLTELFVINPQLKPLFESMLAWEDVLLSEQICRLGRHSAYQSTAHLLLELFQRLRIVGQTEEDTFISPLTQQMMADTLGLSFVHLNRTLKKLCDDNCIRMKSNKISLLDIGRLKQITEYRNFDWKQAKQFSIQDDQTKEMQVMY